MLPLTRGSQPGNNSRKSMRVLDTLSEPVPAGSRLPADLWSNAFGVLLDGASTTVAADVDEAARRGIQGAPVFFLNAQRVDGLQRWEFYTAIADGELKNAPAQQASAVTPAP